MDSLALSRRPQERIESRYGDASLVAAVAVGALVTGGVLLTDADWIGWLGLLIPGAGVAALGSRMAVRRIEGRDASTTFLGPLGRQICLLCALLLAAIQIGLVALRLKTTEELLELAAEQRERESRPAPEAAPLPKPARGIAARLIEDKLLAALNDRELDPREAEAIRRESQRALDDIASTPRHKVPERWRRPPPDAEPGAQDPPAAGSDSEPGQWQVLRRKVTRRSPSSELRWLLQILAGPFGGLVGDLFNLGGSEHQLEEVVLTLKAGDPPAQQQLEAWLRSLLPEAHDQAADGIRQLARDAAGLSEEQMQAFEKTLREARLRAHIHGPAPRAIAAELAGEPPAACDLALARRHLSADARTVFYKSPSERRDLEEALTIIGREDCWISLFKSFQTAGSEAFNTGATRSEP